jgi:outer membrane receptor protein involved in Fe transport
MTRFGSMLLYSCAAPLVATLAAVPAAAAQEATYNFDIPAQPLPAAIIQFSRQSGIAITAPRELVSGKRSGAVKGSLTATAALTELLSGSGLRFEVGQAGSIAIVSAVGNAAAAAEPAASSGEDLSQNEKGIAEILVVGRKTQNVDIRRSENDPQPYVVFNSDQIERSGANNLEDFLRSRLSMNTQAGSNAQDSLAGTISGNVSRINLRGLGAEQTLILIDGRRAPRVLGNSGSEFTQADINGIPIASIERIEILPSTAGGIYGGGAVGGVINIIRKRDYNGLDLGIRYNGTTRGGGEGLTLNVSGGFTPNHGDTQINFSASRTSFSPLEVGDNDLWRRGRGLLDRNDPLHVLYPGYTTNISAQSIFDLQTYIDSGFTIIQFITPNLVLDDGTPLNSTYTSVPLGYPGPSGDAGARLLGQAGHYNFELSNDLYGRHATLLNNPKTSSFNAGFRQQVTPKLSAFVDLSYYRNEGRATRPPSIATIPLSEDDPGNPFQQAILAQFPIPGYSLPGRTKSETKAWAVGAILKLPASFVTAAEFNGSSARSSFDYVSSIFDDQRLGDAIRDGTLDIFRDVNTQPLDLSPYLLAEPIIRRGGPFRTNQTVASSRTSGPIFHLPGGNANLTFLLERRVERAKLSESETPTGIVLVYPARTQAVNSGYVEASLPIFSDRNHQKFAHELELQLSLRHDRYRTTSARPSSVTLFSPDDDLPDFTHETTKVHSTNYTIAAKWAPIEGLSLRGSASTGFLPPSINQLISTVNPGFPFSYVDPARGDEFVGTSAPFVEISGGSPSLQAERSHNTSFGVITEPLGKNKIRLSIDYSVIRKSGEIRAIDPTILLSNEDRYPGRVIRGPNLPTDAPGEPGPITILDFTLLNVARTEVKTIDFNLDAETDLGRGFLAQFYGNATRFLSLRTKNLRGDPFVEYAGFYDGPLKWRANAGMVVTLDRLELGWNVQYYGPYSVRSADPGSDAVSDLRIHRQGAGRVPAQIYNDLSLSYRLPDRGAMSGVELRAGMQNVFDAHPPAIADPLNGYSAYGDPRLRRFSIALNKHLSL